MANQTSLTEWLFERREVLNLQYKAFAWPKDFCLRLFDYECRITTDNETFVGRGSDADEATAIEKSSAEALERAFCFFNGLSSEGAALRKTRESAQRGAEVEAVERFHFQRCLRFRLPIGIWDPSQGLIAPSLAAIKKLHPLIEVDFGEIKASAGHHVLVCLLGYRDQGFAGISAGTEYGTTAQKCLIEALRNFTAYLDSPAVYEAAVASDANLWCGQRAFYDQVKSLFSKTVDSSFRQIYFANTEVLRERVPEVLHGPFVVVRSQCAMVSA